MTPMTKHFIRAIDNIKKEILSLSTLVEERLNRAMRATRTLDGVLAQSIIDADTEIDQREVEIEEECLKILALHQPVAIDLRFIVAVLKINNDLERIGDLSVNIASRALALSKENKIDAPLDLLNLIAEKTQELLKKSLHSLIELNTEMAREVCLADEEIDEIYKEMYQVTQRNIENSPHNTKQLINYLSVSRNLERIADHATNIAEDVIYMIEGEIIRHRI